MLLPNAPAQYDQANEAQVRHTLEQADKTTAKLNTVFDKILMRDTATGVVKTVVITSGAWVIT